MEEAEAEVAEVALGACVHNGVLLQNIVEVEVLNQEDSPKVNHVVVAMNNGVALRGQSSQEAVVVALTCQVAAIEA